MISHERKKARYKTQYLLTCLASVERVGQNLIITVPYEHYVP